MITAKELLDEFKAKGIENWKTEVTSGRNGIFTWFNQVDGAAQMLTWSDGRREAMVVLAHLPTL